MCYPSLCCKYFHKNFAKQVPQRVFFICHGLKHQSILIIFLCILHFGAFVLAFMIESLANIKLYL